MKKGLFILAHLTFWGLNAFIISRLFGVEHVEINVDNDVETKTILYNTTFIYSSFLTITIGAIVFYTNIKTVLIGFFKQKSLSVLIYREFALLLGAILAVFTINTTFFYSKFLILFPSYGIHILLLIFYTGLSFAYGFVEEWFRRELRERTLIEENLNTELSFLKSQINPHFLFNTLNNLFSMAQKADAPEVAQGLSQLSGLMRYMIYDSNVDLIPIKREVEHIEHYIEVQQLRLSDEDDIIIDFQKSGDLSNVLVAPMLLIPFIENAFKHGIRINERSIIRINIEVTHDAIDLEVSNRIFRDSSILENDVHKGLGLDNVQKRLKLLYPERHSLSIKEGKEIFRVNLQINVYEKD